MRGEHVGAATAFTKPKINFRELLPEKLAEEEKKREDRFKINSETVLEGRENIIIS